VNIGPKRKELVLRSVLRRKNGKKGGDSRRMASVARKTEGLRRKTSGTESSPSLGEPKHPRKTLGLGRAHLYGGCQNSAVAKRILKTREDQSTGGSKEPEWVTVRLELKRAGRNSRALAKSVRQWNLRTQGEAEEKEKKGQSILQREEQQGGRNKKRPANCKDLQRPPVGLRGDGARAKKPVKESGQNGGGRTAFKTTPCHGFMV